MSASEALSSLSSQEVDLNSLKGCEKNEDWEGGYQQRQ